MVKKKKILTIAHKKKLSENNAKYWLGKKRSKETKEKISKSLIGHKYPKERNEKISKSLIGNKRSLGFKQSKESNQKRREKLKGRILTNDHLRKILKRNEKSSLEIRFERIIIKLNLPYKFVGNGDMIIGKKVPDFINTNGEKIAIEVFCKRHKEKFRGGLNEWKEERENIFNELGWKLLFFDETELNKKTVTEKMGGLING
ncbi:MAG TPA: hypothetical protein VMZ91_03340 [Candidatus Paceibacterota bacterium]|nr:hypothetical protein [Candidatus Paceibacterota bacterium]